MNEKKISIDLSSKELDILLQMDPQIREQLGVLHIAEETGAPPDTQSSTDLDFEPGRARWLNKIGFKIDPFQYVDGASDPQLISYFYPVPGFLDITSDLTTPTTRIVLGAEGSGKSSFRNAITLACQSQNILTVVYDNFQPLIDLAELNAPITIQDHTQQILKAAIKTLAGVKIEISAPDSPMKKEYLGFLKAYVVKYSPDPLTQRTLENRWGLEKINSKEELPKDVCLLLRVFHECIKAMFEYSGLYFLIDPIQDIHADYRLAWIVLEPLLSSQMFLTLESDKEITFVFFLNSRFLEPTLTVNWIDREREKRVFILEWKADQLRNLLHWRLKNCSNRNPPYISLNAIAEVQDLDDIVIELANHSPRRLIVICNRIFNVHCQKPVRNRPLITQAEVDVALRTFRKDSPVEQLIQGEEGTQVEFKSTLRINLHTGRPDNKMKLAVAKTLTAFMNSEGGTLLIGVDDEGRVIGLDADIHTLHKKNIDGFQLTFYDVVDDYLGKPARDYIDITFHEHQEKKVCIVKVRTSPTPVYCGDEASFYIRMGNSTRELNPREMMQYVKQHWEETSSVSS
jgi:hypothetical protein